MMAAVGVVVGVICLAGYVGYKVGRATMRAAVKVMEFKLGDR